MCRHLLLMTSVLLMLAVAPPQPVAGDESGKHAIPDATQLKPLVEILALARKLVPGKVLDVELERDDDAQGRPAGHWIYEIEVLTADNRVVELEFDAVTGQLVEIEGAPWPAGVPRVTP